jgi:chromate transporter
MSGADLLSLFGHCLLLSLLSIGGAIATVPDLQRQVVVNHQWMSDLDFTASIALAQAAPGPNLLFVAVVGFNAGGLAGAAAALGGMLLPSTVVTMSIARWGRRHREDLAVRAFVAGMAPVTLGLLLATGALLAAPVLQGAAAAAVLALAIGVGWRTRINPVWLVAAGAGAGALGWV